MQRRKAEHRMRTLSIQQITDSVRLTSFTDPSFKTMALSANLLLPLSQETAAKRGILPSLASRATIEFPNYTALNTRLSQLYGASVHSSVRKLGDYQVFGLAASGISSRYAFGGENMAEELCRILASMLFHPLLDKDGEFPEENFSQEKRQLLELKDAEFNDKVAYAHRRCEQLLFQGQPTGIDRYGSREDLAALKRRAWWTPGTRSWTPPGWSCSFWETAPPGRPTLSASSSGPWALPIPWTGCTSRSPGRSSE